MLRKITYHQAKELSTLADKEYVAIDSNPNNIWFGYYNSDDLIGVACYLPLNNGNIRLKGLFVKTEFRRKGIAKLLTDACIRDSGGECFSAFATDKSLKMYSKYFNIINSSTRKVQIRNQGINITFIKFNICLE